MERPDNTTPSIGDVNLANTNIRVEGLAEQHDTVQEM
jgi:hypothetical protein